MILQTQDWVLGAERHILSKRKGGRRKKEGDRKEQRCLCASVRACVSNVNLYSRFENQTYTERVRMAVRRLNKSAIPQTMLEIFTELT